jgi:hypothetical protein
MSLGPRESTHCPVCLCNVENRFTTQFRDKQRHTPKAPVRNLANHLLLVRMLLRTLALVNLLVAFWLFNQWQPEVSIGGLVVAPLLVFVVAAECVARAIYHREKWAWTGGVVVFTLALPTLVGIAGLFLLMDSQLRQEYLDRSAAEG